ncbi:MAG TPA: hypothetical protein VL899_13450 [Alphaproteobacteria bacterium]|nr:hypothetical protein [Alphaproteobacteria bacterium]
MSGSRAGAALSFLNRRIGERLEDARLMRWCAAGLFLLCLAHRLIQLALLWPDLHVQILDTAGNMVPTMPSAEIMTKHPWWGLWYLQQEPPITYGIFAIVLAVAHTPEAIALICLVLQMLISAVTGAAMALLLWRLRFRAGIALGAALLFLLSGDLLVIEYHTMGQMYHNLLSMMLLVLLCHVGMDLHGKPSVRAAVWLGVIVGLLFLIRATFSFFAPVMLAWLLIAFGWRKPVLLLAFLVPVALLQGSWMLKNYAVYGYISSASSSWGGANLYHGEVGRHGSLEFHNFIANHPAVCKPPWHELTVDMPPKSTIFYFIPVEWPEDKLPAEVIAKDREADARRGSPAIWDSLAAERWSTCLFKEFKVYWLHRPRLLIDEIWRSYEIFWQPIRQYAVIQPNPLVPDMEIYSHDLNLLKSLRDSLGEVTGRHLMLERPFSLKPLSASDFHPVPVIALPAIPSTISILNFLVIHSFPILLLVRWWRSVRVPFPPVFWLMSLLYLYAGGLSSLGEYSENMRYRLEIEPIIWVLSLLILWQWGLVIGSFRKRTAA